MHWPDWGPDKHKAENETVHAVTVGWTESEKTVKWLGDWLQTEDWANKYVKVDRNPDYSLSEKVN